jgi:glycosyltransferase involved in cell wall biosynthesis
MPEKVRAIIVDLSKRFGGASTRSITLAKGLKSWEVAICGLSGSPVVEMAKKNDIPVITVGRSRIDPRIPFRIAAHIRRGGYQILDTQNIQSKFWGSIAALLANVTLVSTLNSWYESEHGGSLKGKLYTTLDLLTNWNTKGYIVVSETVRDHLSRAGIAGEKVDLICNAVELNNTATIEPGDLRKKFGLPHNAKICVAVGRLVWAKGYEDLISAFSSISGKCKDLYVLIIGDGVLRETLRDQIERLGLSERMLLLGFQDRETVLNILHYSDIFVMSSRSEGLPFALLEAAAIGLPIVSTDCGGIPEIVTDEKEALLVPVGDKHALASALVFLYKDREAAEKIGKNAMNRIRSEFNLSTQVAATKQAYSKALTG